MLAIILVIGFIPLVKATNETRIYQTDSVGTVETNKPSFVMQKDGQSLPAGR